MGTTKRSFTLIELLTVIAIISILIGVLVPSMSRSLSGNRLASDVEVLRAKIEETRLLAGSTQTADESLGSDLPGTDRVGYYGILFPTEDMIGSGPSFYAIVRLSRPMTQTGDGYCDASGSPSGILYQVIHGGPCIIERVNLSTGVSFNTSALPGQRIIGFRVPSQQVVEICRAPFTRQAWTCTTSWGENPAGPVFNQVNGGPYLIMDYRNKRASINFEPYTGKLNVVYN
ncbi:MAG: prepilin-type N-terminal cleavage/methylation domain-containing protein [Patescibacteria group bacterium]